MHMMEGDGRRMMEGGKTMMEGGREMISMEVRDVYVCVHIYIYNVLCK